MRSLDPRDLMARVAFVFQNVHLFKESVLENVRAARPDATRDQVLAALHAAQCDDIVARLPQGADTVVGARSVYLSGGERQRISIARAILQDASVVVLADGRVAEQGSPAKLLEKGGVFRGMVELQQQAANWAL